MLEFVVILLVTFVIMIIVSAIGGVINSKEPYACPNCGHIFGKKWYGLMFKAGPMARFAGGELRLRCPSCKKVDLCQHTTR
jgi:uncharacterized C2H2 Zn-finger protein